jgi:PAS domain-containing protein
MLETNWFKVAREQGWELLVGEDALYLDGVPSQSEARAFVKRFFAQLAASTAQMKRQYFQVRYPGASENSCRIPVSMANSFRENYMSSSSSLEIPNTIWMGGWVKMSRTLYNALGEMIDSDRPQGLVTAADSMQIWLNPAAVQLFKLSSIEQAVPRDTSRDWLPIDLERKRQMIRDAGENPFEIDYRTQVGDGTWKQLVNRYQLIDNAYLIGMNISSEIIEQPSEISAY